MKKKHCSKCKKTKNIDNFRKDSCMKSGLYSWCRLCVSIRNQSIKHSSAKRIIRYRARSKKKGICFNLSTKEFETITAKSCIYCGGYSESASEKFCGIDRVNSEIGYKKDNVVPCCWNCNRMKGSLATKEFMAQVERIYKHKV